VNQCEAVNKTAEEIVMATNVTHRSRLRVYVVCAIALLGIGLVTSGTALATGLPFG
jgi:hypothetical protein